MGVLNAKTPLPGAEFKIWPTTSAPEVTYFGEEIAPKCRATCIHTLQIYMLTVSELICQPILDVLFQLKHEL